MNSKLNIVAAATALLLITGCATKAQTGALVGGIVGAAALGPVGGTAAAHYAMGALGLVAGGIIGGNIGKQLDEKDHKHVAVSVEKNSTETWTSSKGVPMKAETKQITPEKKEVTVTAGEKTEKTTVIKSEGKWIRE